MLFESLKKLGIEDYKVLPKKTLMKIEDYNRITKTPIGKDKEGNPTERTKLRLQSLVEDIIFEAKVFMKQKAAAKTDEPVMADVNKQEPVKTPTKTPTAATVKAPPADPPQKGFLQGLLGF